MSGFYLPPFEGFTDDEAERVDEVLRIMEGRIKPHITNETSALVIAQHIYDDIEKSA